MNSESCDINGNGSSCSSVQEKEINFKEHWNKTYSNSADEKLGWFESDLTPTIDMIKRTGLPKSARILNVGAGSTTLIDELLQLNYSNLLATDISEVSLNKLKKRIGIRKDKVEWIVDDLTNPTSLYNIHPIDLWIDRAVLHFFTKKSDQDRYFSLLKEQVKKNGFVLLAEFNLEGAKKCAGLPINRYSKEMLIEKLGDEFVLVHSFNHTYTMPSGDIRPYIYTLFRREN